MTPKNILVPVDAKVHLLNVVSFPMLGVPEAGIAVTASMVDSVLDSSQKALDKLADARRKLVSIGQVVQRSGDPREVILQVCGELAADLIVMSTHGRRGLGRLLLGSVAESVLRTASCPVLTIRAPRVN